MTRLKVLDFVGERAIARARSSCVGQSSFLRVISRFSRQKERSQKYRNKMYQTPKVASLKAYQIGIQHIYPRGTQHMFSASFQNADCGRRSQCSGGMAGGQSGAVFDQVDGQRDRGSWGETPQMAIESVNIEPPAMPSLSLRSSIS